MLTSFGNILLGAVLFAALGAAAPAAAVSSAFGEAVRENFEGYAEGPLSLQFCEGTAVPTTQPDDCLGILSGGSIMPASLQFPAVSGTHVYAGTDILFDIANTVDYVWYGFSLNLSAGDSPVQFSVFEADNDLGVYIEKLNVLVPAGTINIPLGIGTDAAPVGVHRFRLQSASLFAIDDLQIGLETVMPGIPEPAAWLMLITGFGAVGTSLRRRRAAGLADPRITV